MIHSAYFYLEPSTLMCYLLIRPSSLDAVLFNHLARIMEFPAGMHSCLVCYPGLVNYYELIMKRYFSAARGEKTSDNPFIVCVCV